MGETQELEKVVPAQKLMANLAKQIDLAFHDAQPRIINREDETQTPLNASHVAVELVSLNWVINPGVYEGTPPWNINSSLN